MFCTKAFVLLMWCAFPGKGICCLRLKETNHPIEGLLKSSNLVECFFVLLMKRFCYFSDYYKKLCTIFMVTLRNRDALKEMRLVENCCGKKKSWNLCIIVDNLNILWLN